MLECTSVTICLTGKQLSYLGERVSKTDFNCMTALGNYLINNCIRIQGQKRVVKLITTFREDVTLNY